MSRAIMHMAAGVFHGSRLCLASLFSGIFPKMNGPEAKFELVAIIRGSIFDEMPLKVGNRAPVCSRGKFKRTFRATLEGIRSDELANISNTELHVGLLLRSRAQGRLVFIHAELPCPLQHGDRNTAEVIRQRREDQIHVPLLPGFAADCPIVLDMATRDRAAGNLRQ